MRSARRLNSISSGLLTIWEGIEERYVRDVKLAAGQMRCVTRFNRASPLIKAQCSVMLDWTKPCQRAFFRPLSLHATGYVHQDLESYSVECT